METMNEAHAHACGLWTCAFCKQQNCSCHGASDADPNCRCGFDHLELCDDCWFGLHASEKRHPSEERVEALERELVELRNERDEFRIAVGQFGVELRSLERLNAILERDNSRLVRVVRDCVRLMLVDSECTCGRDYQCLLCRCREVLF